jgi:hypothetical protein
MEAGKHLAGYGPYGDLCSFKRQIWAALKTYKHLPYTFVYLFSYFLLADVLFDCRYLESHLTSFWTGAQYYWNPRCHMSERQVQFLVPAKYIPGLVPGDYFDN